MESELIEFINFRELEININEIIKNIENKNINLDEYAKYIYYHGGIKLLNLSILKKYKFKEFLKYYENIKKLDISEQKQCFEKLSDKSFSLISDILNLNYKSILEWNQLTNENIILYGSSILYFLKNLQFGINNLQNVQDIDVSVNSEENAISLCEYIKKNLIDYANNLININSIFRIKNIQIRKRMDRIFIRIDICDDCKGRHFLNRLDVIDISQSKNILNNSIEITKTIKYQHPVSFFIGLYDKYAGCLLNNNKLTNNQLEKTKTKIENRINNFWIDQNLITINIFEHYYKYFENIKLSLETQIIIKDNLITIIKKNDILIEQIKLKII